MASITEAASGFPSSNGHIPFECGTIAEVLGERGWNTYMLGKWHLCPSDEMNMASTKRNWPLGRGFERYYGFLGGETNQWYPDLIYDNHPAEQPATPEDGYHLTADLTDKAIEFVKDAKMVAPDKPFFMYFCPGATHAPHHAPGSGSTSTRASSTWATSATASSSSSASGASGSSPRMPSSPR
jgi:arylsulfatase